VYIVKFDSNFSKVILVIRIFFICVLSFIGEFKTKQKSSKLNEEVKIIGSLSFYFLFEHILVHKYAHIYFDRLFGDLHQIGIQIQNMTRVNHR